MLEEIQISVFNPSLCRGEIPLVVDTEYPPGQIRLTLRQRAGWTTFSFCTGRIKIQCQAIVGSISGQDYYDFGVNETRQCGQVWSRL